MTTTIRRRTTGLLAVLLGAVLAVGACGGDDGDGGDPDSTGGSAAGYPVTVSTQFGALTVKKKPERIVVLGSPLDVDILAGLGEPAVVYSSPSGGEDDALALAPWLDGDSFGKYVDGLFTADFKPSREAIAKQNPDLIVYFGAGIPLDKSGYRQLTEIAPTYAYVSLPPWREEVARMGKITGERDLAARMAKKMNAEFAAARGRLAGLKGKTFFHGVATPDGIYSVPGTVPLFKEMGLTPAANQVVPPTPPKTFSLENLDQVDADIAFLGGSGAPLAALKKDPRFADLPSVRNKAMIYLQPLLQKVTIPSQIGPASVPWLMARLVPALQKSSLSTGK